MSWYKDEQARNQKGQYKTFWTRRRKIYGSLLVALVIVTYLAKLGEEYTDGYLSYKAPTLAPLVFADEIKPDKIEEMRRDVLDRLANCENPKAKPIVFDTNGLPSIGIFQWQPHSFQHYWEKKTGEKITEKQAVLYALDDNKARELAAWVIFETERGVKHDWINCGTKWNNLQELVDFIAAHD